MFDSNVNKIFLGTDGAASSRVGQILLLRVEGSIPYSAPLRLIKSPSENDQSCQMSTAQSVSYNQCFNVENQTRGGQCTQQT